MSVEVNKNGWLSLHRNGFSWCRINECCAAVDKSNSHTYWKQHFKTLGSLNRYKQRKRDWEQTRESWRLEQSKAAGQGRQPCYTQTGNQKNYFKSRRKCQGAHYNVKRGKGENASSWQYNWRGSYTVAQVTIQNLYFTASGQINGSHFLKCSIFLLNPS